MRPSICRRSEPHWPWECGWWGDRGSALVVVGIAVGTVGLGIMLLLGGHERAVRAAQAQASADAVALAGAADDDGAAQRIAVLNNVTIVSLQRTGDRFAVTVDRAGIARSATAIWELVWVPPAAAN